MSELRAEMAASVWKHLMKPGQTVSAGDSVVILESMKMEIPVIASESGTVVDIFVAEGSTVQEGDLIATIE